MWGETEEAVGEGGGEEEEPEEETELKEEEEGEKSFIPKVCIAAPRGGWRGRDKVVKIGKRGASKSDRSSCHDI